MKDICIGTFPTLHKAMVYFFDLYVSDRTETEYWTGLTPLCKRFKEMNEALKDGNDTDAIVQLGYMQKEFLESYPDARFVMGDRSQAQLKVYRDLHTNEYKLFVGAVS